MNRAVLIMPYFGVLPSYFSCYLKSVAGKWFDVLMVTDLDIGIHPENVLVLRMSFNQVRDLAAMKLNVRIGLETPKKLCDFKPMYGMIFEDYIQSYEYWIFGDCDLVYGNAINGFLEDVFNSQWDIVSLRRPWVSGPFCIVRNNVKCRQLFMRANNWRDVAGELGPNNLWDECGACWHLQLEDGTMTMKDCEGKRDSFGAVVFRSSDINFRHEDDMTEVGLVGRAVSRRSDGTLCLDDSEIMIYHFNCLKTRRFFTCKAVDYQNVNAFWIDDTGFYYNRVMWKCRVGVNMWRKAKALIESFHDNGFKHWVKRFRKNSSHC